MDKSEDKTTKAGGTSSLCYNSTPVKMAAEEYPHSRYRQQICAGQIESRSDAASIARWNSQRKFPSGIGQDVSISKAQSKAWRPTTKLKSSGV